MILLCLGRRQHVDVVVIEPVAVVPPKAGVAGGRAHLVAEATHVDGVAKYLVRLGGDHPERGQLTRLAASS